MLFRVSKSSMIIFRMIKNFLHVQCKFVWIQIEVKQSKLPLLKHLIFFMILWVTVYRNNILDLIFSYSQCVCVFIIPVVYDVECNVCERCTRHSPSNSRSSPRSSSEKASPGAIPSHYRTKLHYSPLREDVKNVKSLHGI